MHEGTGITPSGVPFSLTWSAVLPKASASAFGEGVCEQMPMPAWSCQRLIDGCLQLVQPRPYVFAQMDS